MEPFDPPEVNDRRLSEAEAGMDPISLFARWFEAAGEAGLFLPEAAALATSTAHGCPSCRMVLLKSFGPDGFVFYTNYESRKASELKENPRAALTFHWGELERQVRIEGGVERTSTEEAAEYFASRPRESRISAWASPQSHRVGSREDLEARFAARVEEFEDGEIPLPPFWGGYVIAPVTIEFWQGRTGRLHDRLLYERSADGTGWSRARLAP